MLSYKKVWARQHSRSSRLFWMVVNMLNVNNHSTKLPYAEYSLIIQLSIKYVRDIPSLRPLYTV